MLIFYKNIAYIHLKPFLIPYAASGPIPAAFSFFIIIAILPSSSFL